MSVVRTIRTWIRLRRQQRLRSARAIDLLRKLTSPTADPQAAPRLVTWLELLEREAPLRQRFPESWLLLPTARADSDAGWPHCCGHCRRCRSRCRCMRTCARRCVCSPPASPDEARSPRSVIGVRATYTNRPSTNWCLPPDAAGWRESIARCRDELERVHVHMEEAGVSSALVYDLLSIEASLDRLELLAAARTLLDALVRVGHGVIRRLHRHPAVDRGSRGRLGRELHRVQSHSAGDRPASRHVTLSTGMVALAAAQYATWAASSCVRPCSSFSRGSPRSARRPWNRRRYPLSRSESAPGMGYPAAHTNT
jgi:hypothetical protein